VDERTLAEARQWVRENRDEGVRCPCCDQFAKVYKRSLNSGMAWCLIKMHRMTRNDEFIYTPRVIDNSGTLSKLRYWDLLEGDERGWWRVTNAGRRFVRRVDKVGRWAVIYNDELLYIDDSKEIDIVEALNNKFDYESLMRGE